MKEPDVKIVIDPDLILNILPNYAHGRRLGLTDKEIEASAQVTFSTLISDYNLKLLVRKSPSMPEEKRPSKKIRNRHRVMIDHNRDSNESSD